MEDTNSNKENHKLKHHNDTTNDQPKLLQSQEGEPLDTINGPISNERANAKNLERKNSTGAPFNEYSSRHQSLFRVSSEDSDDSPFDDFDEVGRMMPGVLAEGVAYTVKETLNQGYIEKKGSGFDWIGSRAWKKRWAVLVVSFLRSFPMNIRCCADAKYYNEPTFSFFRSCVRHFRKQEPTVKTWMFRSYKYSGITIRPLLPRSYPWIRQSSFPRIMWILPSPTTTIPIASKYDT